MKSTITAIQIEGNLLAPDMTSLLMTGSIKGQAPEDFGLSKSDKLADEIATAWGDAKAYWTAFQRALARLSPDDTGTSITRELWAVPLLRSLGYDPIYTPKAEVVDGRTYAISHRAAKPNDSITNYDLEITNYPPIHIIGCRLDVDKRPPSGNPRLSAHALVQEYLNKTEHLWAIATNGYRWRLLRDSSLMTRLTYIEFDLEQILNGENFAEFGLFYRLFHRSRLPEDADDADKCLLEFYHQEALQQGGRVRDKLRDGVEKALNVLGNGFIQHPQNEALRQKFSDNNYELKFYRQLLRLIYRLLFLMVAESRNLLLIGDDVEKGRIYQEYYSIERLRALAERPHFRREGFQDLWEGLWVTFLLFDENWRGELLGLSPLNGDLFGSTTLPDLEGCAIDNHDLLIAIRHLSLYEDKKQLRRVNYLSLDVEELGSVYESLLDFHPKIIIIHNSEFGIRNYDSGVSSYEFQLIYGSDRKTTGSYYTPPQLVQQLIKTALEPVIKEKVRSCASAQEKDALKRDYEQALLSLKVVDPACGSGHFLLAAARRIGKELARVRTGEAEPGSEPLREAIRDVIQNCIYGVDINPLAVDLCKVALWIEGFCKGKPLSFLDHRIKCGNSLVGVLDLDVLQEGIPDNAYKAVTGDDKKLSSQLKKDNKKQRQTDLQGQLSIFESLESERTQYAESFQELGEFPESTPQEVKEKQARYQESRKNPGWWRDFSACNLWTAAFFMGVTPENLQLLPTTAALSRLVRSNVRSSASALLDSDALKRNYEQSIENVVDAANKLGEEKRFFHWCLEFPEVFEEGGFSCVLGNPPWERIKLQEKEFFASRSAEIANAANKAAREKLIKELHRKNPGLAQAFGDAKHDAEAQSKFIRESGRFPLTAVGDINTYAVFAETTRRLISARGRVGIIVPTGIATDDTCKRFFGDLTQKQALASLFDFENREYLFSVLHTKTKFCLLTVSNSSNEDTSFAFMSTNLNHLKDKQRVFSISSKEIILFNPNTGNCPLFRSSADAELTKKIYQHVPVLENEKTGSNPWGISFMRMFDMSNDSALFKNEPDDGLVPLYEAKMFWHFDHRWTSYSHTEINNLTDVDKANVNKFTNPRYWVKQQEVETRLLDKWNKKWLLCFRGVTDSRNERSGVFSIIPKVGVGNSAPVITTEVNQSLLISCLQANFSNLVFDFVVKQKIGGMNFNFFIVKQLPVLPPESYTQEDIEFISTRVLELVYTSWDMQPFAQDMGYDGEPFIWNPNRRALLRAELDAYYAKLYGLTRDELRYIIDPADVYGEDFPSETFRVLKNNEMKQFGEYRTQRLVLESWDKCS